MQAYRPNQRQPTLRHLRDSRLQTGRAATSPSQGLPMSAKVLIERMELVRHIVDEAQRIAPDSITFHCSHPCQAVDISNRTVTLGQNGSSVKVDYALLKGADGVNSKIRDEVSKQIAGIQQQWFGLQD